jgi:hypothetical protein
MCRPCGCDNDAVRQIDLDRIEEMMNDMRIQLEEQIELLRQHMDEQVELLRQEIDDL